MPTLSVEKEQLGRGHLNCVSPLAGVDDLDGVALGTGLGLGLGLAAGDGIGFFAPELEAAAAGVAFLEVGVGLGDGEAVEAAAGFLPTEACLLFLVDCC